MPEVYGIIDKCIGDAGPTAPLQLRGAELPRDRLVECRHWSSIRQVASIIVYEPRLCGDLSEPSRHEQLQSNHDAPSLRMANTTSKQRQRSRCVAVIVRDA